MEAQSRSHLGFLFLTKDKADTFVKVSTQAAWYGIGAMVVIWVTIRFIGPAFGWWHLAD